MSINLKCLYTRIMNMNINFIYNIVRKPEATKYLTSWILEFMYDG
jgi:hypothetical protein